MAHGRSLQKDTSICRDVLDNVSGRQADVVEAGDAGVYPPW